MPWRTKKSQNALDAIEAFAELVIEYKAILENLAADPSCNNFARVQAHLLHMMSAVLLLSNKGYRPGKLSEEDRKHCVEDNRYISDKLHPVISPLEKRLAAENPMLNDRIEFEGALACHLSDIYDDVWGHLRRFEQSGRKAHKQAAREWKQGFIIHWGPNHVYEALFILHSFVYDYDDLKYDYDDD